MSDSMGRAVEAVALAVLRLSARTTGLRNSRASVGTGVPDFPLARALRRTGNEPVRRSGSPGHSRPLANGVWMLSCWWRN